MSYMYSDGDYEKELKAEHKSIMKSIKEFDENKKKILKSLSVPVWIKEGSALVREDMISSWKRFVKKEGTVRNVYGAAVENSLLIMRTIETHGMDKALQEFEYLDGQWREVFAIVAKYSRHGISFVNEYCAKNPKWLENYPKFAKFKGKQDSLLSVQEKERADERLQEALDYMREVTKLQVPEIEGKKIVRAIADLEKIDREMNLNNKNNVKR